MNKLFVMLGVSAALLAFSACSNQEKKTNDPSEKTYPTVTVSPTEDLMSQDFGKGFGALIAGQIQSSPETEKLFDKEAFLRGLELVMKCDTTIADNNFLGGIQQGFMLLQQLAEIEFTNDVTFDHKKVVENLIATLNDKKTLSESDIEKLQNEFKSSVEKARNENLAKRQKTGEKFLADKLAADKNLKKTQSGLVYKITKQGKGSNFKLNDNVIVKYKGMHTDGKVFDQDSKGSAMKVNEDSLIPGFVELLQLMNPGAKAYAIMPASIAYSTEGSSNNMQQKDIKGNETLVFEIETVGIANEKDPGAR